MHTIAFILLDLLARAGGGQKYRGRPRGGGGGGGGGDGDGLFYMIYWLFRLCFRYPLIGIPVLLVVCYVIYHTYLKGSDHYTSAIIRRGHRAAELNRRHDAVGTIARHDRAFDEPAFEERVTNAFLKIQDAWARQDLTSVRPFISDGIHERFNLQFEEQRRFGYRNAMEGVAVHDVEPAQSTSDGLFDTLTVAVTASANDYQVSLKTGERMRGGDSPEETFTEYWSFIRRRGTQTRPDRPGLIEGNCPNCGAGLEMNQSANCQHCGAALRSGEYDWVLSEITQAVEWEPGEGPYVPGEEQLRATDPEFNLQHLEDRASVIFWRKALTDLTGDTAHLRKMSSEAFVEGYVETINSPDRAFFADCAVGSVQTLGLVLGDDGQQALVEIRWSGMRHVIRKGRPESTGHSTVGQSLFVLWRKPQSRSNAATAVASAHCPRCGAPESSGTSNACDYCGTVLNDGGADWVLSEIHRVGSDRARELLEQAYAQVEAAAGDTYDLAPAGGNGHPAAHAHTTPGTQGLMAWAINLMLSDGAIDPQERKLLDDIARRRGLTAHHTQTLIDSAAAGHLEAPQPTNQDEAKEWLGEMAAMALADGKISHDEKRLLREMADRTGLSNADLKLLMTQTKTRLYRESREALRRK